MTLREFLTERNNCELNAEIAYRIGYKDLIVIPHGAVGTPSPDMLHGIAPDGKERGVVPDYCAKFGRDKIIDFVCVYEDFASLYRGPLIIQPHPL